MDIYDLSESFLGIIGLPEAVPLRHFQDSGYHVMQCRTGNIGRCFDYVRSWSGKEHWDFGMYGAASEESPELVKLKAIAEAAERYASAVLLPDEYQVATAHELGDNAFDWRALPTLSEAEQALPLQMMYNFDPERPIRWIAAIEMRYRRIVQIPVVMSHIYPRAWTSERFWNPISTGVAVHSEPYKAMLGATLEVIERDALALNWLVRRPLRRLEFCADSLTRLGPLAAQLIGAPDIRLYEASTDLGIPIIYARRYRPGHEKVANVVACACDFSVEQAIRKALSELVMITNALEMTDHQPPADKTNCESLLDGATYMMRDSMSAGFNFLDEGGTVSLATLCQNAPPVEAMDAEARLHWLTARLDEQGKRLYIAELTCDELADVGLRAFRAVLPGLQPMSFLQRAQFLGSERLREFQRWLGRDPCPLPWLNPLPQPFA